MLELKTEAKMAYEDKEFLVSTDETFRPVNLYTGLDGALYIVDLRKGVIQHRAYMTSYLREKILKRELEKTTGIGRIYKVVYDENKKNKNSGNYTFLKTLKKYPNKLLNHKNAELRLLAQKEIIFSNDLAQKDNLLFILKDEKKSCWTNTSVVDFRRAWVIGW